MLPIRWEYMRGDCSDRLHEDGLEYDDALDWLVDAGDSSDCIQSEPVTWLTLFGSPLQMLWMARRANDDSLGCEDCSKKIARNASITGEDGTG